MPERFPMRHLLAFLFLLISVLPVLGEDWVTRVIDLTINTRFDEAEAVCADYLTDPDSSLKAYFYLSSILNSKMTHFENDQELERFLTVVDTVVRKSTIRLENSRLTAQQRAQLHFYRGSALGYRAFYLGKKAKYLAALKDGFRSVDDLEEAVKLDSSLYDAYLGIGVYQYWRSTKLRFLLWTPFLNDLREKGIYNIKKTIRYSRYSRYMAMHQFIYILLNEGRFDEALRYATEAVEKYPDSPFMRWAYAHTLYKMHKNQKAIEAFKYILGMIESGVDANASHEVTCRVRMAEIYRRIEDREKCRQELQKVLAFNRDVLSPVGQLEFEKAQKIWRECFQPK